MKVGFLKGESDICATELLCLTSASQVRCKFRQAGGNHWLLGLGKVACVRACVWWCDSRKVEFVAFTSTTCSPNEVHLFANGRSCSCDCPVLRNQKVGEITNQVNVQTTTCNMRPHERRVIIVWQPFFRSVIEIQLFLDWYCVLQNFFFTMYRWNAW